MGMILVARSRRSGHSGTWLQTQRRAQRRCRWRIAAGMALGVVASVVLAVWLAGPDSQTLGQIASLRAQIHTQNAELHRVRANARQEINRMAIKLGRLQADAMRLNTLGQRLVAAGKLDPAEFDFSAPPALGGAEHTQAPQQALPFDLAVQMEQLTQRFESQQTQLDVLQSLLTSRTVTANLVPSGMPVQDGVITSPFGRRIDPFTGKESFHPGLDIGAPRGEAVHAVAAGVVTYAGRRRGYGKVVEIDHGDGYMTRYAHNSKLLAHVGEYVHKGEVISDVGSTGRSTGPHVHFEVWHDGKLVNPVAYVKR